MSTTRMIGLVVVNLGIGGLFGFMALRGPKWRRWRDVRWFDYLVLGGGLGSMFAGIAICHSVQE